MCAVLIIAGSCNIDPVDFIHKFPIKKILSTRKVLHCLLYYLLAWQYVSDWWMCKKTIYKKKPINYYNENLIIIKKKEPIVASTKWC